MLRLFIPFSLLLLTVGSVSCCRPAATTARMTISNQLWDTTLPCPDAFQKNWGGYQVYSKQHGRFIDAPEADQKLLRNYPYWIDKGSAIDGTRLTITVDKQDYKTGEAIRIGHIVEETEKGRTLYIMGPKTITGEFVNDSLRTPAVGQTTDDYPWLGMVYDGAILPSPGYDHNFEITEYRFDQPGTYHIQWKPGKFASNVITVNVR